MAAEVIVPLRITILKPVPGVALMLQKGRDKTVAPSERSPDAVTFDCTARARFDTSGTGLRWLGEFVQGPVGDRFIYVTVGKRAGQPESPWDRRAKVKLAAISPDQVREVVQRPGKVLEARFDGAGRDGGPSCATVPLLGGGWRIVGAT